jgi:hypothetical protein
VIERIGDEVERTLGRAGSGEGLALREITRAWPAAVGPAVARHAWPARVGRDGVLHVATTSSTWAFELDRLAPEIADKLSAVLGADRLRAGIRFRVGLVPEPGRAVEHDRTAGPRTLPASPEETADAAEIASGIDDPELRELVARAARASLSSHRLRPPDLVD